jgi:uncharacterized protein (TIGR04255 family)
MPRKPLKHKPLIEAIFEFRWELQEQTPGMEVDPHYKILIGRMYDRISDEYPFHEQLPTATMPDEIAGYVVQHRFRKGRDKWPLVQMGPGILTVNDTGGYVWEDFNKRISHLLNVLFESYPDAENNLKTNRLLLRYIDAVDSGESDIFNFLREKMKMNIEVHPQLFEETGVSNSHPDFDLRFSFPSAEPPGIAHLRFVRGKRKDVNGLIWETMVQSGEDNAPATKKEINSWVHKAHDLTDDWFFKMIEGDLLRRFE